MASLEQDFEQTRELVLRERRTGLSFLRQRLLLSEKQAQAHSRDA